MSRILFSTLFRYFLYSIFCVTICFPVLSCTSKPAADSDSVSTAPSGEVDEATIWDEDDEGKPNSVADGTYSADIEYYNPNTGTSSSYTLDVDVENNAVTNIYFENGGNLDSDHIESGGELDADGTTTIYTDKGYELTVTVNLD